MKLICNVLKTFQKGDAIKETIIGSNYALPDVSRMATWIALAIMFAGIVIIGLIEITAGKLGDD